MTDIKQEVHNAIQALKSGGVVLYPSDTVWGLGCDPTNEQAVEKLFEIKQRDASKSVITLISEVGQLNQYVQEVPEVAWDIVEFADKPLTVIYPNGRNVHPKIMGDDKSIALRLVTDGFVNRLVHAFGRGITSTSANLSGQPTPMTYKEIPQEVIDACDYVVDPSFEVKNINPSRIIKLGVNNEFKLIRS